MSTLKVELVNPTFLCTRNVMKEQHGVDVMVPVVRLDELLAWLEAHQYPRQYGTTVHNGVIDDLLAELRDLA